MEIVVISNPYEVDNEVQEVTRMFKLGLRHFHIRKPRMSRREMSDYIKMFPKEYRKKLVLHGYHTLADQFKLGGIHLSRNHRHRNRMYHLQLWFKRRLNPDMILSRTYHKLTDITNDRRTYTYTFLSPVFDSVSHSSLSGGFSKRALLIMIPQAKQPVFAFGGITLDKLEQVENLGFHGVVLLGTIWEGPELPHQKFKEAQEKMLSLRAH